MTPRTFDEFFISEFELKGSPVSREDAYRIWQAAIKFQVAPPADVAGIVKRMGDCELHSNPFSAVANPPSPFSVASESGLREPYD